MLRFNNRTLRFQCNAYALFLMLVAMLLAGTISYVLFRDMCLERVDQNNVEDLNLSADELATAIAEIQYTAAGMHQTLEPMIDDYLEHPQERYRRNLAITMDEHFQESLFMTGGSSRTYSYYLWLPDNRQISWPAQNHITTGAYFQFHTLPRHQLPNEQTAYSDMTLWLFDEQPGFKKVLYFACEFSRMDSTYLLVIGVQPAAVFSLSPYEQLLFKPVGDAALTFAADSPFALSGQPALTANNSGRIYVTGHLQHLSDSYVVYGRTFRQLGELYLAVLAPTAYGFLRQTGFFFILAGLLLSVLFILINWRLSRMIVYPFEQLSRAIQELPFDQSPQVKLPERLSLFEKLFRHRSMRSKLTAFFILGSILPVICYLTFCISLSQRQLTRIFHDTISKSATKISRSISDQLDQIQTISRYVIFNDHAQALMLYGYASPSYIRHTDELKKFLLLSTINSAKSSLFFINLFDQSGNLLFSTHDLIASASSDEFILRNSGFIEDPTVSRQWSHEYTGSTIAYSLYHKAFKKSVDSSDAGLLPVSPGGFPLIGYLQVGMQAANLQDLCSPLTQYEGTTYLITDSQNRVIAHQDSQLIGLSQENIQLGEMQRVFDEPIRHSDSWHLAVLLEDRLLIASNTRILFLNSYLLLAVAVLIWLFTRLILFKISLPINQLLVLSRQQEILQHPLAAVTDKQTNEVSILIDSFNHMLSRLQEQITARQISEKQKQEAELIALQSQINPHFLYNVFTTISFTMLQGAVEDAADMLDMIGQMFRTGVYRGNPIVRVEEELRHVKSYLDLQLIRYSHKLSVHYDLDPEIYQYSMLKLTLQPLVENSIYHGIEVKEGSGSVTITGRVFKDCLQFTITDDGVGIKDEDLTVVQQGLYQRNLTRGIGLQNVNERIKLYFGESYGLSIHSIHQSGTEVVMTIPHVTHEDGKGTEHV